jgi:UTP--glucose-1-phosphate uridylyltransferase
MNRIRKVVITAAGRGTRQYPASATVQKELFPLVDTDGYSKPTLQIIVEEALRSGLEEICIVTNPVNADPIRSHFRGLSAGQKAGQFKGKEWALELSHDLDVAKERITYVTQTEQEGFGHAVHQARDWVGSDPFILLVGDHVYLSDTNERCVAQILRVAERTQANVVSSITTIKEADISRYGIVAAEAASGDSAVYNVTAMVEKPSVETARTRLRTPWLPEGSYYSFFGIHALPARVFDCLDQLIRTDTRVKGEIQLTSALEMLLAEGGYVATEVQGTPHDMGIPKGLVETQIALALRSPYREQIRQQFFDIS